MIAQRLRADIPDMSCMARAVALHEIADAEAYVIGTLRRVLPTLPGCEREDLEAEGLAILWELEHDWNGCGSFRGYASSMLGRRLIDAWRRAHPGARAPTGPLLMVSLDAESERPSFDESRLRPMTQFTRAAAA